MLALTTPYAHTHTHHTHTHTNTHTHTHTHTQKKIWDSRPSEIASDALFGVK